jgi:signal transduction histidine kinase
VPTPPPEQAPGTSTDERRQLQRDLHDGVQNELVGLIIKLATAQQDPDTPPGLAQMLHGLESRAQAVLDSVRNIARGIYPPVLASFGVREALRELATRAPIEVSLGGTVPRSSEEAEEAVYFACSEAIQNAVKHAGSAAQVTVRLRYGSRRLTVTVADDGSGFDAMRAAGGTGLQNIRDRIDQLGGTARVSSTPGRGTSVSISVPWPPGDQPPL